MLRKTRLTSFPNAYSIKAFEYRFIGNLFAEFSKAVNDHSLTEERINIAAHVIVLLSKTMSLSEKCHSALDAESMPLILQ